jgi:hypothetical protein
LINRQKALAKFIKKSILLIALAQIRLKSKGYYLKIIRLKPFDSSPPAKAGGNSLNRIGSSG